MKKTKEFLKPKMTFGDTLKFTAYSWAKLIWMRDRGPTEVAGYCVTATEDPLLVTDFILIKQECTGVNFDLDPQDGIEYTERMMDQELPPWTCMNILAHTHPQNCPTPSIIDEENFKKAFSHPHWAIMFIITENNATYCRLKINIGPGVVKELKVAIDWNTPFNGSDIQNWEEEYKAKVTEQKFCMTRKEGDIESSLVDEYWSNEYEKWVGVDQVDDLDCFWDDDGNVCCFNEQDDMWYYYNPSTQKWYTDGELKGTSEIDEPDGQWTKLVISWTQRYIDERRVNYG